MIKIRHIRVPSIFGNYLPGAVTVASKLTYEEIGENDADMATDALMLTIEFAMAFCNKHDTFVKKHGVSVATERLLNQDENYYFSLRFPVEKMLTAHEINFFIDMCAVSYMNIPYSGAKIINNYHMMYDIINGNYELMENNG